MTLQPLTRSSAAIGSQLSINTDEETTIATCNKLAQFILENHLNEYNNDSVTRLNQRTINQIDLEFALDIIDRGVITRIVNPEAIDIESQDEPLIGVPNEKLLITREEYNSLIRYKEYLSTINAENQDQPIWETDFCERIESRPKTAIACIASASLYISFVVYYFLKRTSDEPRES